MSYDSLEIKNRVIKKKRKSIIKKGIIIGLAIGASVGQYIFSK